MYDCANSMSKAFSYQDLRSWGSTMCPKISQGRYVPKSTLGEIGLNGEGLTEVQKVKGLTSVQNSISSFKLFSFNKNQSNLESIKIMVKG